MQDVGSHGVLHYGSKGLRRSGGVWQMWNPHREALWGHHVKLRRWSLSCNGDPRMLRIPEWVGCLPREAVTQGVGGWRECGGGGLQGVGWRSEAVENFPAHMISPQALAVDMALQSLASILWNFSHTLADTSLLCPHFSLWEWKCLLCPTVCQRMQLLVDFTGVGS